MVHGVFGHIVRCPPNEDYHRSVAAATQKPSSDWKRPKERPSHTWLRAIEADLKPLNIGLLSAWKKATILENWRSVVDTATLVRHKKTKEKKKLIYSSSLSTKVSSCCKTHTTIQSYCDAGQKPAANSVDRNHGQERRLRRRRCPFCTESQSLFHLANTSPQFCLDRKLTSSTTSMPTVIWLMLRFMG